MLPPTYIYKIRYQNHHPKPPPPTKMSSWFYRTYIILIFQTTVFGVWTFGVKQIFNKIQHIACKNTCNYMAWAPTQNEDTARDDMVNHGHWEQLSQVFRSLRNRIPAHVQLWFELITWVIGTLHQSDSLTVSRCDQYSSLCPSVCLSFSVHC